MDNGRSASLLLVLGALTALSGCASAGGDPARRPTAVARMSVAAPSGPRPSAARPARTGITITTRSVGPYGRVLVDGRGRPLYLFTADRGTTSRCYGACGRAWPVALTRGTPRAGGRARRSLVGTTRRRDGRLQATYGGRPLYFYVADRPGVALCHDVREFGGLWLLVRSDGRRVDGRRVA